MALPPKLFYSVPEIANRWSVTSLDIVGWAIDGRISLSAALPLIEVKRNRLIEGLAEIAGQDVFDLFAAGSKNKSAVQVHRFRQRPGSRWERILNPTEGVPLKASSVLIARTEAERFEREHQLFGQHQPQLSEPAAVATAPAGAPSRYDWNGFAGAVARRVHDEGMPASQGELVRDMLEWFAASGAVPDESTVRRRVQALWPVLTKKIG
jgi:hypothetical protein